MQGTPTDSRTRATDGELVARLRAGDQDAFNELYRAHVGAVAAAVRDRVREPEARADVAQEAFAQALERLDSLRDPEAFRPWLLAIARNTAVDHVRANGRVTELDDAAAAALPDREPGPQQWAELHDLASLVRVGVAGLSRRDATAVALVTRLGMSTQDLAAALGLSPGAAKVALHRARRRLRHALRLQLLAHRQAGACEEFARLHGSNLLTAAAEHIEDCPECTTAVAEVAGFSASPSASGPATPIS